jgi:hypothetical protein
VILPNKAKKCFVFNPQIAKRARALQRDFLRLGEDADRDIVILKEAKGE